MPRERVKMYHPDIAKSHTDPPNITKRAFEAVWKDKGWKLWAPKVAEDAAANTKGKS